MNPKLAEIPDLNPLSWEDLASPRQEQIKSSILSQEPPPYVAFPQTVAALAAAMEFAAESRWPVLPWGSGSKLSWGKLVQEAQLALSTHRLNRILEHAVGDLTVTVEAGIKLAELQEALQQQGQFLPLDPSHPATATIGGIVATADSGSWRQRYGGVRDLVLGLSFVRADGKVAKAGGRVVKNVAGYDLMKLFVGSYGTLGIITQVSFRLYPLPEASATLALAGEQEAIASAAQRVRQSGLAPTAAQLLSRATTERLNVGGGLGLLLRFQSIPESVAQQLEQVRAMSQVLGLQASSYREEEEESLWQLLGEILQRPASESAITCKIGVVPEGAVAILAALAGEMGAVDLGSGLGRLHLAGISPGSLEAWRSLCQEARGFLTILTAPASLKQEVDPWGYAGNAGEIMKTIKAKFDPHSLLSRGREF